MKLIVTGSAAMKDGQAVFQQLQRLVDSGKCNLEQIIHGGCVGVDSFAGEWARTHGIPVRIKRPQWKKLGKDAAPTRNQAMVDEGDAVLAISLAGRSNTGTKDIVNRAKQRGIPVIQCVYRERR